MERVSFYNRKGEKLAGLLFMPSAGGAPVVVVCHGFSGSKEGRGKAVEMAGLFSRKGYAVLLFDFTGCGESGGSFENITLTGQIEDLSCAVDYCLQRGLGPVITAGRSFGGTTAVCHAASDTRVAGVCTWAAPASVTDLFLGFTDGDLPAEEDSLVMMAGAEGVAYLKKSFFTDLSYHDVPGCASLISPRSLLVVHGTADEVVPASEASIIYDSAREPKHLSLIKGADHQFSSHYPEVWEVMLEWVEKAGIT